MRMTSVGAVLAEPASAIRKLIARVKKHFAGKAEDFADVVLDLEGVPEFHRKVYVASRRIPLGKTVTYGELARSVGSPDAARAVGQALGRNPIALIVPCHRILAAGKKPGGFSAHGGITTKAKMLAIEGVVL